MADQGGVKLGLDTAAAVISLLSLAVAIVVERRTTRWKAEVEGRRPFAAELQKLSALITQSSLTLLAVASLRNTMGEALDRAERAVGPNDGIRQTKKMLEDLESKREKEEQTIAADELKVRKWFTLDAPSPTDFAEVQKRVAHYDSVRAAWSREEAILIAGLDRAGAKVLAGNS